MQTTNGQVGVAASSLHPTKKQLGILSKYGYWRNGLGGYSNMGREVVIHSEIETAFYPSMNSSWHKILHTLEELYKCLDEDRTEM